MLSEQKNTHTFCGVCVKKNIHNSYGSIDCIRFEGMISASAGTPLFMRQM